MKYKRQKPLSPEERFIDGLAPLNQRLSRYNWRRILKVATQNPGYWYCFDKHGRSNTVSVVNNRTVAVMRHEFDGWDFRAKMTDARLIYDGRRQTGKLWIMATERTPSPDE